MNRSIHVAVPALLFSAWLLNPAWDTFGASPTFRVMAMWLPEAVWGILFVIIGGLALVASVTKRKRAEIFAAALASLAWSVIAISFALSNIASTGVVVYFSLWLYAVDTTAHLWNRQ